MKKLLLLCFLFAAVPLFSQTFNEVNIGNNVCDLNNDGYATFDMSVIRTEILGNNSPSDYTVTFHHSQAAAQAGTGALPELYTNFTQGEIIIARILAVATGQVANYGNVVLHVNPTPIATPQTLAACEANSDGLAAFDLNQALVVNTDPLHLDIAFYTSQADAEAGINALPFSYVNTQPFQQVIYYRFFNIITGCHTVSTVTLNAITCSDSFTVNTPSPFYGCSDGVNPTAFDLDAKNPEILGNLNTADYNITYHETQQDALDGINALFVPYSIIENSQLLYVRVVENINAATEFTTLQLINVPQPYVGNFDITSCDDNNDGFAPVDLGSVTAQITQNNPNNPVQVIFYASLQDAQAGSAPISYAGGYTNTIAFEQTLYVRAVANEGCSAIGQVHLHISDCAVLCPQPLALSVSNVFENSAVLHWNNASLSSAWQVYLVASGMPAPVAGSSGFTEVNNLSFVATGLSCGTAYSFYVRSVCASGINSNWSGPYNFMTIDCPQYPGEPQNLYQCSDLATGCFNLSDNDANILGTLLPANYTVAYFATAEDAFDNVSPIATTHCVGLQYETIYYRLTNILTAVYNTGNFIIQLQNIEATVGQKNALTQCDDNNDGNVTFDLTTVQSQFTSGNTLQYYLNYESLIGQVPAGLINTPSSYSLAVSNIPYQVFIKEIVVGGCDRVYSLQLFANGNCNPAVSCIHANSLCNALGLPFSNSVNANAAENANYGCLFTHPNPTWFYLPVSQSGTINLKIEQNSSASFNGQMLDPDYIVYGPFTSYEAPCYNQLTAGNIVSCSYSAAGVEYPVIANAQQGQYYLMMVTNYSNLHGFLRISELSTTVGAIDCSGFRFNAFLDANNNGTKENNEMNLPIGQFHYQLNEEPAVHHITAPAGVYNLYDNNPVNSYNVTYTVNPGYASQYTVNSTGYDNVQPMDGMGLSNLDFPVTALQTYQDVSIALVPTEAPRAGFPYTVKLVYTNNGNQVVPTGTLTFQKDAALTLNSISQTGTAPTASGFTFSFANLLPFETRTISIVLLVPPVPQVALGTILHNTAAVTASLNDFTGNNTAVDMQAVIGSYDPNDKLESHGNTIIFSDFTASDYLYYTIRFENTGNAAALRVRVEDVLSEDLDETTVEMVAASHPYVLDRVSKNLSWRFDNIQLPPSVANTTTGKGYVTFRVKPKTGWSVGDTILNTASIYFDYNPAVITNTFQTEFVAPLAVAGFAKGNVRCFPNPGSGLLTVMLEDKSDVLDTITVYDIAGKLVFDLSGIRSVSGMVDLRSVGAGVYFMKITTGNGAKATQKVIIR